MTSVSYTHLDVYKRQLMWSGMKAAVGNAHQIVKRNVPYVSKNRFAEGVLEIVEKFIQVI